MKKEILILLLLITSIKFAQPTIIPNSAPQLNLDETLQRKILSHKLVADVRQGLLNNMNRPDALGEEEKVGVVIYFEDYPSGTEISELEALGISCFVNTWTPPLENHPYGFILAKIPPSQLNNALSKSFIKKLDSSTHEAYPHNNLGTVAMAADMVWDTGFDGTGVKVAVLDSGIDDFYEGSDFPAGFERMDYSSYDGSPGSLDPIVANSTTGHGTHVAGSVLGRGILSAGNIGNGGGAYKGSAPGAGLVFLKIGGDASSSSTTEAMIGAMDAVVTIYDADILSMSYGGWYDHHDGSSATEQKVDWVYSMGKPFFISAGNSADDDRHYSGTVAANSSTDYIQVNVSGVPLTGTYKLLFNLVWQDGIGTNNDLWLLFYDNSYTYLSTLTYGQFESIRGTESEYLVYDNSLISDGTYFIRVVNASPNNQDFHIYEAWNGGKVRFQNPDLDYTIGQPASADHAFAVGAYTSRASWTDYAGVIQNYGEIQNDIANFSSRGPRIDGVMKPQITAPGSRIISLRDKDVLTADDRYTIDNDGNLGIGQKEYYVMRGTSMACPLAAGAAALYLQYNPNATPSEVYDALQNNATEDTYTGTVPNNTFGHGKLNIYNAIYEDHVELELVVFLEGAYTSTTPPLSTALNHNLPTMQPFNMAPWNYDGPENFNPIPDTFTDWVLVELRTNASTPSTYRKAALVNEFGNVSDFSGAPIKIKAPEGTYWIVVHHRNHLSVMSSSSVTLSKVTPPLVAPQVELKSNNLMSY